LSAREAAVVAAVQRPIAPNVLLEPSGVPAWRTIPSWAVVGTEDRVITPAEQEFMAKRAGARIVTVPAGHLSLISHAEAVTELIVTAAKGA
jgi:pimeloyl-ACP methyl ester carboxylesterase